ncbi:hypothetical protein IGI39_000413 [Enterococcus sp. AZ135]|uniref:hypothetical protein n=1 Tax=unclassified Enterococcus TaxID=2608891 RepID=UPI003F205965
MNEFKQVFNQTQQFLILQAYIDSQLSTEELMNFTLLETSDEIPAVFYSAGILLIHPRVDLDQFTHEFFLRDQAEIRRKENELIITLPKQKLHFHFDQINEAEQIANDLIYLYSDIE